MLSLTKDSTNARATATPQEHHLRANQDEIRIFHHNALRVLGENYLVRAWLPKKGPAFVALILAMRAHIWYDFGTGEQKTRYFPEAATIAKKAGISRSKVFELFKDPDMALFIKKAPRRRYSPEHQREVQTSNIYWVAMDDPPTPEDRHLVEEEQQRIEAIMRGDMIVEDDEPRPSRAASQKTSESKFRTLRGVQDLDSHSRPESGHEDQNLAFPADDRDTSITSTKEGMVLIASRTIGNQATSPTRAHKHTETETKSTPESRSREADRIESANKNELTAPRSLGHVSETPALLSEGEVWRADARGWLEATRLPARPGEKQGPTIVEHHMMQYQVDAPAEALAHLLAFAAPRLAPTGAPVEILESLAEQARRRATLYVWRRDPETGDYATGNPGGYYLKILQQLISDFAKTRDLSKLDKKTASLERSAQAQDRATQGQPAAPTKRPAHAPRSAYTPRQVAQTGASTFQPSWQTETREDEIKASLYQR